MDHTTHKLFPDVISLANEPLLAYRAGFSQPTVGRPEAFLAALTSAIIPATDGADADVPAKLYISPPMTTR